jgi:hypothetical protein
MLRRIGDDDRRMQVIRGVPRQRRFTRPSASRRLLSFITFAISVVAAIPVSSSAGAPVRPRAVELESRGPSLTSALREISRSKGVAISVDRSLDAEPGAEAVALALAAGVSLEEALRRLSPSHSVVAVYQNDRLVEVRVYGPGTAGTGAVPSRLSWQASGPVRRTDQPDGLASHDGAPGPEAGRPVADAELTVDGAARVLQSHAEPENVARALDVFREVEAAPLEPLLAFAEADQDADLRAQVFEVLVDRGRDDPRVRSMLQSVAARDKDAAAREAARELLRTLETRQ